MADKIGFAYSFWDGEYGVKKGSISLLEHNPKLSFFRINEDTCTVVDSKPGVMWDNVIWFEKRNDHKALRLLMDNEYQIIHRLEEQLKMHNDRFKKLIDCVEENLKEETNEK